MNTDLLASVEACMRDAISAPNANENIVSSAALEHIASGGSRIRASLSLDASARLGVCDADTIALAAVCELLHNASLIQDDLLDRTEMRRGRTSVWVNHGEAIAVCAGDLLLAGAFAVLVHLQSTEFVVPVLALVHARTREVILGQGTEHTCNPDTLERYEAVAIAKSASLLSLPLELSLLVSNNQAFSPIAQRAAIAFATAYQMMDDLEDYEEDMRKGAINVIATALRTGSSTYEAACARVLDRIEELLQILFHEAQALPMGCGSAMTAYAQTMRIKSAAPPALSMGMTGTASDER